jgi:hypothetical protein
VLELCKQNANAQSNLILQFGQIPYSPMLMNDSAKWYYATLDTSKKGADLIVLFLAFA